VKLTCDIKVDLKVKEVQDKIKKAAQLAMRDTVVDVANAAIKESPVKTGNNRRSIFFGVAGMGQKQASQEGRKSRDTWTGEDSSIIDESKIEGAVYSTSGYGGILETGSVKMAARLYMKPAIDRNFTKEKMADHIKKYLGG